MNNYFPIKSQTSKNDKKVLLSVINLYKETKYNYIEIGSYLGGSLPPFLQDENCQYILSIDDRERVQPDERGISYDYRGITTKQMINNLCSFNIDVTKLETFDGSIENYKAQNIKFDIAFIDGEHTDTACFRDFIYSFKMLKDTAICIFHDSYIVYKGIQSVLIYLKSIDICYKLIKIQNSDMTLILFGEMLNLKIEHQFDIENLEQFYKEAEKFRITSIINNNKLVKT
jgi:hypothetical protein